jgi:mono/diheme cytochrome c family protein
VPSIAPQRARAPAATAQQLTLGGDIYRQNCAACHGARGEGATGSNAPPLTASVAFEDVKNMVSRGSTEMPAMSAVLTPEQIDAVSHYVTAELTAQ